MAESGLGKKQAFDDAVREAYPKLLRAALVLCANRSDAEDAVQETLYEAQRSYDSFKGNSSATTWLYAILLRVGRRLCRRSARGRDDGVRAVEIAARGPSPDAAAELEEESRSIVEAIRGLPDRQREVVTLYYIDDLSYSHIAAALGVSVGTVKSSMFAARTALRNALRRLADERKA